MENFLSFVWMTVIATGAGTILASSVDGPGAILRDKILKPILTRIPLIKTHIAPGLDCISCSSFWVGALIAVPGFLLTGLDIGVIGIPFASYLLAKTVGR